MTEVREETNEDCDEQHKRDANAGTRAVAVLVKMNYLQYKETKYQYLHRSK